MVLPDIFAYVGIHLRYDTTWYVLTDRSLRIRRGILTIHETTISFENVQNVEVRQGPLQRYFGIADVLVTTAGGGVAATARAQTSSLGAHVGILQGLDDAEAVRNQILASVERTRSAGLGDEHPKHLPPGGGGRVRPVGAAPGRAARDSRQRPPPRDRAANGHRDRPGARSCRRSGSPEPELQLEARQTGDAPPDRGAAGTNRRRRCPRGCRAAYGEVRGYIEAGIYTFKGVAVRSEPDRAGRFTPPASFRQSVIGLRAARRACRA